MRRLLHRLESRINDYSIKKKFFLFYTVCVLIPLIVTDSTIVYVFVRSERASVYSEMQNVADAVRYSLNDKIEQAMRVGKGIYSSRRMNDFLDKEFSSAYDYVTSNQELQKYMWLESTAALNNINIMLYSDNDTIVNGGQFLRLESALNSQWYAPFLESGLPQFVYFDYDDTKAPVIDPKRRMLYIRRMDMYRPEREKLLVVDLDYSGINRYFKQMNYMMDIYICWNGKIVLSNGRYASKQTPFRDLDKDTDADVGFRTDLDIYGANMQICVCNMQTNVFEQIRKNILLAVCLLLLNTVLPFLMFYFLHRSFTVRLRILSDTFQNVNEERLVEIEDIHSMDEIGILMHGYNSMARHINDLIQIVYKSRIKEQEMAMARQKAELLALHSQINPHFLFNTLECIRMHSIIKKETETAGMIEKLGMLQRQYVDWGDDWIPVSKELSFVEAYLAIQKYRFGDRLFCEISAEDGCGEFLIPKLTIVTFVENACVHGIECKTMTGWIFVRVLKKDEYLYLEIEDTGKGMDEEEMERLRWKMNHASIQRLQKKERVGVINACLRLKMKTDGEVSFDLDGEEGTGLTVQIKIPLKYLGGHAG